MGGENLLHLFRGKSGPIPRLVFGAEKGRFVIGPMDRADALAADGTRLSDIPSGDDSLQQAVFGRGFNLAQTLLAAILTFRPACALPETQMRVFEI